MKNYLALLTLLILTMLVISLNGAAAVPIQLQVDGKIVQSDVAPIMESNRVLVPVRSIFEMLGGEVTWNEAEEQVFIKKDYMTIELTVGKTLAYIHRDYDFSGIPQEVELDVPAKLINSRTYVPVRFIAESLGADVTWDEKTATVIIENPSDIIAVERSVAYKEISISDGMDDEIKKWVEENSKTKGFYSKAIGEKTYLLAAAGEKPTGGYRVEINEITMVAPGSLVANAVVIAPSPDDMVTQVITYPYCLVAIDETNIEIFDGNVTE